MIDVQRGADRYRSVADGIDSRHCFSFGRHYDPANTRFGLLVACNEEVVAGGRGFDLHRHRDVEIVTWVLEGELEHRDSTGHRGVIGPGVAQRMTAGSGIEHAEQAAGGGARFVQMWLESDAVGVDPGYEQCDVAPALDAGERVVVASGMAVHVRERMLALHQERAALHAARLRQGAATAVPGAPWAHLLVTRGTVDLESAGALGTGDSARITDGDGQRVVAGPNGAEVLVWEMHPR